MEQIWNIIYADIVEILKSPNSGKANKVYGRDLIDLPDDKLILYGTKLDYLDGTIELTLTTPYANPRFEWKAEITIKVSSKVEHYLLRHDHVIVEAYGKNIYDVSLEKATKLQAEIAQLKQV